MTREYSEEVTLRLGARSLGVAEGASEGDVLAFDADGEIAATSPNGGFNPPAEWTVGDDGEWTLDLSGTPGGSDEYVGYPWRVVTDWLDMSLDPSVTALRLMGLNGTASQIRLMEDDLNDGTFVELSSFYGFDMRSDYAAISFKNAAQSRRFYHFGTQSGLLTGVHSQEINPATLLNAGEMTLTLDPANGGATLYIAAKTLDGTVVGTTVPLT